jgi:hypothetical protein
VTTATVFVIGGHAFEITDLAPEQEGALVTLTTHMWNDPNPVGHIDLTPKPGVTLRVSLRDIVAVEIDHTR